MYLLLFVGSRQITPIIFKELYLAAYWLDSYK